MIGKATGKFRNLWTSADHSDCFKIGQNTKKSPGDLRKPAVSSERPSTNADVKNSR